MQKTNNKSHNKKSAAKSDNGGIYTSRINRQANINNAYINTVNIKGFDYGDQAVLYVNALLERKNSAVKVIILIHGYGSRGAEIGSVTKDAIRAFLHNVYKVYHKAVVINGEDFTILNAEARNVKERFPELEIYMRVRNPGVTFVVYK